MRLARTVLHGSLSTIALAAGAISPGLATKPLIIDPLWGGADALPAEPRPLGNRKTRRARAGGAP